MKQRITELLAHPRFLALQEIDNRDCPHDGYIDRDDPECRNCGLRNECEWLSNNDAFIALARRPVDELVDALVLAIEYTEVRHEDHNTFACVCDSCLWLREARRFVKNVTL